MGALREFIAALDQRSLLRRVQEEVGWHHEIGERARQARIPLLFENIKDYPGWSVFVNGLSSFSSIALALGIRDEDVRLADLKKRVRKSLANPIEPTLIAGPPPLENRVFQGIDLAVLPVPKWSEIDAGRYIGTWHLNISRDPENGDRNIGVYRMQIVGPNQTTVSVSPRSHLALQISKAERAGSSLPMAVAIGVDERLIIAAAAAPPYGVDEYSVAGGLIGRPVELVKGMTQPLEVPADSEVIIEGFIKPHVRVQDGPFLDYAGIPSTNLRAHLFEATALLFRNKGIFRGTAVGEPGAEDHQMYSVLAHAGLADFHGSRIRQSIQSFLLRRRAFKVFQLSGRVGQFVRGGKVGSRSEKS